MDHELTAFYPGFVRKAITFTIDDGNVTYDRIFLGYVKPAGLRGTFNLCGHNMKQLSPEGYRVFYDGFEIANHVSYHPFCFDDSVSYNLTDTAFDRDTADPEKVYPSEIPGIWYHHLPRGWRLITDPDTYLRCAEDSRQAIEKMFGKNPSMGLVWPFHRPENERLIRLIHNAGYRSIRKTGSLKDSTGYSLPADRLEWTYNAAVDDLEEESAKFEAFPDDGTLKFFCFGVHSIDFEKAGKWDVLERFCEKFGNRPDTYWYASTGDIFAYDDAVKGLILSEDHIENPSDTDVFLSIDGRRVTVRRRSTVLLD